MSKINIYQDIEDIEKEYEQFEKTSKRKGKDKGNIQQSQGEFTERGKSDSFISQRTKGRSRY